ncbi:MAG: DUF5618 family protein [Chitinophagales bacterium]
MGEKNLKASKVIRDPIIEAHRYLQNAKRMLREVPIEYGAYQDPKYSGMAAETAYLAALKAIDHYLIQKKNFTKDKLPKSYEGYQNIIDKHIPLNGKLSHALHVAWQNLHVFAHYREGVGKELIREGIENVQRVIKMMDV